MTRITKDVQPEIIKKIVLTLISLLLVSCVSNGDVQDFSDQKYDFNLVDTIKIATWYEEASPLQEIIGAFNKRYPQVKVEVDYYQSQTFSDFYSQILDSENEYDLITITTLDNYSMLAYSNYLADLTMFIEKDNYNLNHFGSLINSLRIEDKLFAIPYRNSVFQLYYNKTLFDQANLEYPDSNMTWEKFRSIAKQLTNGENEEKVYGAFFQSYLDIWVLQAIQAGSSMLDDDLTPFENAINYTLGLIQDGSMLSPKEIESMNLVQNGSIKIFGSGKVAMMPMGEWTTWQLLEQSSSLDFEWAISEMPFSIGGRRNITLGLPISLGVIEHSKNKEIAWEFIKTMCGPIGAEIYANNGSIPALLTSGIREEFINHSKNVPSISKFLDTQVESFSFQHPKALEIREAFTNVFKNVLNGQYSSKEALEIIVEERKVIFGH